MDTTVPLITLNGEANITHEAGLAYEDANATWSDIVDGSGVVATVDEVNIYVPGEYELRYNYTDTQGNDAPTVTRTVRVVDTRGPVISLLGDGTIYHPYRTDFIDPGAEVYDIVDGSVSTNLLVEGEVDGFLLGEYELIYRAVDTRGNDAVPVVRKVIVEDSGFDRTPFGLVNFDILGVEENLPRGSLVGEFNASDPDEGTLIYSLVDGEGGLDNARFEISDNGVLKTGEIFDYESRNSYSIRVRATVRTGHFVEGIFTVSIWDQVAPVVETSQPERREDGMLWIGGKVLDVEVVGTWETGLYISLDQPFYDPSMEGVFDLKQPNNVLEFGLEFFPGEDTKKVYVMAYARNGEGINYGLLDEYSNIDRGKFDNRGKGDIWTGANRLGNGSDWWNSWWFGIYFRGDNGWWYHEGLGWIYVSGSHGEGLWLWKDGLGWVWTRETVYPFLYSYEKGSWYYFYGELDQRRLLYDYAEKSWVNLDDTAEDESKAEELEQ